MQNANNLRLYFLDFTDAKTYLTASLFIIGNLLLPQLIHIIPHGGIIWLPIYFFTLVAAYKYGWKAGLITAIASPLVNSLLFSMPVPAVLPVILFKSSLLAVIAAIVARHFKKASVLLLALVVLSYQTLGSFMEWMICGNLNDAFQDFRMGMPGMLFQIFGGWFIINKLIRK